MRFALPVLAAAALFAAQGLHYSSILVPVPDGVQYLMIGAKAVRGELGVFDDALPGNRMPLPFYVLGLTQLGGPDLLAARRLNVAFGTLTVLLVALVARQAAGSRAGILAAFFLATQGVVVAYFSYESYPAFAAFSFALCLTVLICGHTRPWRLVGALLVGALFLVRSNLWPAVALLGLWTLWRARSKNERLLTVGALLAAPVAFFAWDPSHVKVLAYVPGLRGLAASAGYVSAFVLDDRPTLAPQEQAWAVLGLVRRYEFWGLAFACLMPGCRRWLRGPVLGLGALLAGILGALLYMYPWNARWLGLYVLPYAPLAAILLGIGYADLLARRPRLGAALLAILLIPPIFIVRNPLVPLSGTPFQDAHRTATELRAAVPREARVFFAGPNAIPYLAGLPLRHLQQAYTAVPYARKPVSERVLRRSGFVTAAEAHQWLTEEDDWAVLDLAFLGQEQARFGPLEQELFGVLLPRHFRLVQIIGPYGIYRRR